MPLVVDRPHTDDLVDMPPAPPETAPARRRVWGRLLFPWLRTAVGAPMADDDLLIVNATSLAWVLSVGYHTVGTMPPGDEQIVNVVRRGHLSAREAGSPADSALTLGLTPKVRAVEIGETVLGGTTLYDLKAIERRDARPRRGPSFARGK